MLKVKDKAPDFEAVTQNGKKISLSDFKGQKVVLFFYPTDHTPDCTEEACNLRDHYELLRNKGIVIIGINTDSVKSHQTFTKKFKLPFLLIADTEKKIIESYGVWGLKKFMGVEYKGIHRSTFIISENGIIENIISQVKTKTHAEQILEKVKFNS